MFISLLEEVASFAAIFLFATALAFWSNILSTIWRDHDVPGRSGG
jgi:hypothetical protein